MHENKYINKYFFFKKNKKKKISEFPFLSRSKFVTQRTKVLHVIKRESLDSNVFTLKWREVECALHRSSINISDGCKSSMEYSGAS